MKLEIKRSIATGNDHPFAKVCFPFDLRTGIGMNVTDGDNAVFCHLQDTAIGKQFLEEVYFPMCAELAKMRCEEQADPQDAA